MYWYGVHRKREENVLFSKRAREPIANLDRSTDVNIKACKASAHAALFFDDGPSKRREEILNFFEEYGAQGT
ncbi:unnamed protein product [Clonostachys rhizophaga]|uniref:Uncharacterized protein n=1 Tax=Clonostachys rhizophaga TaxID=160324 RepID=A0A9N9V5I6_9HYPO|nr:unnamed protein product [Clonostachys rhizophaga]